MGRGKKKKEESTEWKCRHCLFMKKDPLHGNMRICFFGGVNVQVLSGDKACVNFHPSRRAKAVSLYRSRVEAGLVGKQPAKKKPEKKNVTAKEMLELLKQHLKKPVEEKPKKRHMSLPIIPINDGTPWPKEERTNAFNEQMCAGRCCKRKELCKHYESWLEHGKPKNAMKMIPSISKCIDDVDSNANRYYSRFVPVDGMSEEDIKEYADIGV